MSKEQVVSTPDKVVRSWLKLWWARKLDLNDLAYMLTYKVFSKTRYWAKIHKLFWAP